MPLTYTLTDTPAPEDTALLEQGLADYFAALSAGAKDRPIAIFVRNDHGTIIGGLLAKTGWAQMYIATIYVMETSRGQGIGARLMEQAEAEGRRRGCCTAWLMTSTLEGKGFYERQDYECLGTVERPAPRCAIYFMKKAL